MQEEFDNVKKGCKDNLSTNQEDRKKYHIHIGGKRERDTWHPNGKNGKMAEPIPYVNSYSKWRPAKNNEGQLSGSIHT